MKWFDGGIPQAIQKAKSTRSVFVVYIYGVDDLSKSQDETWSDPKVEAAFEEAGCIAIKLKANSDGCAQFSQIYPVVCVPCVYFIGETGHPLDVTGGNVSPDQLLEKLTVVMEKHSTKTDTEADAAKVRTEPTAGPSNSAASPSQNVPEDSIEEKQARAQETMNTLREGKLLKEREKEKQEELERREQGKNVGSLRQWQKEQEAKELREQIKKDREEAKLARQRVKDQIAQDREERALKFKQEKADKERQQQEKLQAKAAAQSETAAREAEARREHARLQFRLPDGSALTETFLSSQTLDTARQFLRENLGSRLGTFTLCMTYPRRTFVEADMSQTFLALGLAPSAVIVVLPGSRYASGSSGDSGGGNTLFMMLLAPVIALWNFFMSFLFGQPSPPSQGITQSPQSESRQAEDDAQSSSPQSAPESSRNRTRPKSSYGIRSRREGNIHRLSADDDDEMATWNGNSTQQM